MHSFPDYFDFKKAVEAYLWLVETYVESALCESLYQNWFSRFKGGDCGVHD